MNSLRCLVSSTHSKVHLIFLPSLDLADFQERREVDFGSVQYLGHWYRYVSLRHEVLLISHEARLKAYFSEFRLTRSMDRFFLNTIPAENQFLNFCGQTCARLNADTPLFGKRDWNRRPLFRAINLFLFGSPNEHAVRLQQVWVDGVIIQPRWKDFVNRLTAELARYTIFVSFPQFNLAVYLISRSRQSCSRSTLVSSLFLVSSPKALPQVRFKSSSIAP